MLLLIGLVSALADPVNASRTEGEFVPKLRGQRLSTPDRMLRSAVTLLRRSGPRSVTIDRVLKESGAPRGSVYHYFPRGRDQIVIEAAHTAAEWMNAHFATMTADHTPTECIDELIDFWKAQLNSHEFTQGCPILATSVDDGGSLELQRIAENAFSTWQSLIAEFLVAHGADPTRVASLATLTIAAVEGCIAMCKATKTTKPLDDIKAELHMILDTAVSHPKLDGNNVDGNNVDRNNVDRNNVDGNNVDGPT